MRCRPIQEEHSWWQLSTTGLEYGSKRARCKFPSNDYAARRRTRGFEQRQDATGGGAEAEHEGEELHHHFQATSGEAPLTAPRWAPRNRPIPIHESLLCSIYKSQPRTGRTQTRRHTRRGTHQRKTNLSAVLTTTRVSADGYPSQLGEGQSFAKLFSK